MDAYAQIRHSDAGPSAGRLRLTAGASLVVVQVALSLVLLSATSLMVETVIRLRSLDMGFRPEGVASFDLELLPPGQSVGRLSARWSTLVDRVQALPDVRSASLSVLTPLSGRHRGVRVRVEGFAPRSERDGDVALNHVSSAYFETLGIPLRLGRAFTARDDESGRRVAILDASAARFYFGSHNPLGRHIELGGRDGAEVVHQVVGIVGSSTHRSLRDAPPRFLYLPVQQPATRLASLTLTVRARGPVDAVVQTVQREVLATGADVVVGHVTTLERQVDQALLRERLLSTLAGWFGGAGLLLAAIGLFGVMSYGVARRRREIAVRMALGATARALRWRVLCEALVMTGLGILIGVPMSLAAGRAMTSLLSLACNPPVWWDLPHARPRWSWWRSPPDTCPRVGRPASIR